MMVWLVLTFMLVGATAIVCAPFLRARAAEAVSKDAAIDVYRDRLRDLEMDERNGILNSVQADAERQDIMQSVLASDAARSEQRRVFSVCAPSIAAPAAIACVVVLGSIGLYAIIGRPDLLSDASSAKARTSSGILSVLKGQAEPTAAEGEHTPATVASVDELIDRLKLRLALQSEDAEGWRMLGWALFSTERYAESVEAYAKSAAQRTDDPETLSSYGEALVRASNGAVTADARGIFDRVLRIAPKDPRARFFKGLAEEQVGNKHAALDLWLALLANSTKDDDWTSDLEQRIAELANEVGSSVNSPIPSARQRAAAIEALPADDRSAAIRGMVTGLASRLDAAPNDQEGWIMLIRSYAVLGEPEAAQVAVARAMAVFREGSAEHTRIKELARELGVAR